MNRLGFSLALVWTCCSSLAYSNDYGFPALNTAGRYLGMGWSHHTYHSHVDGRFNVITNRHPACMYPSSTLSHIYSPDYTNYPPRNTTYNATPSFWQAPTIDPQPKNAATSPGISILEREDNFKRSDAKPKPEELAPPSEISLPKPVDPPKPKEPPPSWLKPFLEEDKSSNSDAEVIELEPSPSDRSSSAPSVNRYRR